MKYSIILSVAVIGLSLSPLQASAKHKHDKHEYQHESKKHHKKHNPKHKRKHQYSYYSDLPPGLYKKVSRKGYLPSGWYKKYRHGDILARELYHHGRVVNRRDRKGIIVIEVGNRLIHLVHDTREILSIVKRY